jgi:hypothetical protein
MRQGAKATVLGDEFHTMLDDSSHDQPVSRVAMQPLLTQLSGEYCNFCWDLYQDYTGMSKNLLNPHVYWPIKRKLTFGDFWAISQRLMGEMPTALA